MSNYAVSLFMMSDLAFTFTRLKDKLPEELPPCYDLNSNSLLKKKNPSRFTYQERHKDFLFSLFFNKTQLFITETEYSN